MWSPLDLLALLFGIGLAWAQSPHPDAVTDDAELRRAPAAASGPPPASSRRADSVQLDRLHPDVDVPGAPSSPPPLTPAPAILSRWPDRSRRSCEHPVLRRQLGLLSTRKNWLPLVPGPALAIAGLPRGWVTGCWASGGVRGVLVGRVFVVELVAGAPVPSQSGRRTAAPQTGCGGEPVARGCR